LIAAPLHAGLLLFALIPIVFTITLVVLTAMHPEPEDVTVTVYTPEIADVILVSGVGF
jgi:hypothetical protein